jgi:hypothetical protein
MLSAELKTLVTALQESEKSQGRGTAAACVHNSAGVEFGLSTDAAPDWMVPGAKCQALTKDGLWHDAIVISHDTFLEVLHFSRHSLTNRTHQRMPMGTREPSMGWYLLKVQAAVRIT